MTVPLLVIALALTATYALPEKRRGLIAALVVVNVLMLLLTLCQGDRPRPGAHRRPGDPPRAG